MKVQNNGGKPAPRTASVTPPPLPKSHKHISVSSSVLPNKHLSHTFLHLSHNFHIIMVLFKNLGLVIHVQTVIQKKS